MFENDADFTRPVLSMVMMGRAAVDSYVFDVTPLVSQQGHTIPGTHDVCPRISYTGSKIKSGPAVLLTNSVPDSG